MTTYPEINRFGLTEYHKRELCYPYTSTPAFTFWDKPAPDGESPPGVSPMRAWQDGRCALCGFRDGPLVEDHCHTTGLVRGYRCRSCNTTEGVSDHNLDQWRGGVTVAAHMGIEKVYTDIYGRTPVAPEVTDAELEMLHRIAAAASK